MFKCACLVYMWGETVKRCAMCDVLEDALPHDRENMVDNQGTVDEARRNRRGKVDEEPS